MIGELNETFGQRVAIPPSFYAQLDRSLVRLSPQQAEGVRQRAIAVWVVSRYLNRLGYDCAIEKSSPWNPCLQVLSDLADLQIFEEEQFLGTVECLQLPPNAEFFEIPEQAVMSDRIAYLAVAVNAEETWGAIVGFVPALNVDFPRLKIKRNKLLSRERLIDLLENAERLGRSDRLGELERYWQRHGNWSEQERLAAIAQLESALLLQSKEPLQVECAAQELESLMAHSIGGRRKIDLQLKEEELTQGDREELRSILRRIIRSLREGTDEII
ncbi:DUF1822 family protein [Oxynema aestuarii]|uniref:DUF1822 family protein n=1 Tax=Oxynema aestuarii AP17 TaxID=2064643 RepID=A0A6H1TT20_9CYAN|nr:DUF1822 family protein [Oxynema aestuarii]QIZ69297.1 DUF1822 family protein [Oxynema aestuarii AP17]